VVGAIGLRPHAERLLHLRVEPPLISVYMLSNVN
jgi:hypothetical protein